jgi:hypothetical protein
MPLVSSKKFRTHEPEKLALMQKLLVYQSMSAMEQRRPDRKEWSLEEKLTMIRDAGFDGAGVHSWASGWYSCGQAAG